MLFYRAGKGISASKLYRFSRLIAGSALAIALTNVGFSQQESAVQGSREKLIQEAYAKHDVKIRHLLPQYSGPPLLLDLFHRRLEDGTCDPEQHVAWETHYNGIMAGASIADHGFSKPADATATTLVTIDTFAPTFSLPAKDSSLVVIAKPVAGRVCVPRNRRYVYTKFTLQVLKEFRKVHGKTIESQNNKQLTAVEFGGSVRFPSGYLETFLLNHEGFIEVGEKYVLFLWKQIPSDNIYVELQAYLIRDGLVFPVDADGDAQTVYTKMPFPEFEAKVQVAVDRNIDADVLPDVHGAPH